ncbi:flagellar basal body rod protein FlgB [Peribacillus cavernae]|uniref:Flagellar basal body rod protein FlgB n=1 Tax=Peribacillus cavernae TaxID=1674310 RepID=A0A433HQ33_9BACI|nr:flagellar basal body rod protein FlgB [Peribacillus cavernae]MDQ0217081.1 flagellar basal-body rod protein FlgB [Peribacillus cavernae]RUQ30441.1 flagellar basal body rod protein FlgB [Peribacillus cavernae]
MKLFSNTFQTLENALNYSGTKQKVISQNIANADTPNYKAKDVQFTASFQNELQASIHAFRTESRHYDFQMKPPIQSGIVTKNSLQYNNNGNSVDMDQEMSDLATNQIYYNAVADRLNGKFQSMQNVIRGGK